jgi:hypothetical protein
MKHEPEKGIVPSRDNDKTGDNTIHFVPYFLKQALYIGRGNIGRYR